MVAFSWFLVLLSLSLRQSREVRGGTSITLAWQELHPLKRVSLPPRFLVCTDKSGFCSFTQHLRSLWHALCARLVVFLVRWKTFFSLVTVVIWIDILPTLLCVGSMLRSKTRWAARRRNTENERQTWAQAGVGHILVCE